MHYLDACKNLGSKLAKRLWVRAQILRGGQNFYRRMQKWWQKFFEVVGKTILNLKALKYNNVLVLSFFNVPFSYVICMSKWHWKKRTSINVLCVRIYGNIYNTNSFYHTTGEPSHGLIWSLICCLAETMRIWWASNTRCYIWFQ